MDVLFERAVGMDISKTDAKVCVRVPEGRPGRFSKPVTTYGATLSEVERLRDDLVRAGAQIVVMEATGDYWKPFFFPLAEVLNVELVNATLARNIPGRKSDVSDAQWLAELAAHGLLRGSFVPPEPIRQLRDLTRTRAHLVHEQAREWARLEKNLEDAGIKLSSVTSTLSTKSARHILDALAAGERDPKVLASLAHTSMLPKAGELIESLRGRFNEHHGFMVGLHLQRIDQLAETITALEARTEQVMAPFRDLRDALTDIPGISTTIANGIIAEIGVDMSIFPTPGHLASWAGVTPSMNESAGKVKSTRTRPGNAYLKAHLGIAALAISRMRKPTHLHTKFRRIARKRGGLRAVVAIEHSLLVIIWKMFTTGQVYTELGDGYAATRNNHNRQINAHIQALQRLGLEVTTTPRAA